MLANEQLKILLNDLDIPIWISGEDMQVQYFNEAWLKLTGRKIEDERFAGWLLNVNPEDRERFICSYVAYFEQGEPFEFEIHLKSFDGNEHCLVLHGTPLIDTAKTCRGFVTFAYDYTERKLFETQLSQNEKFYKALFHQSPLGIVILNSQGKIKDVNRSYLLMRSEEIEDVLHASIFENKLFSHIDFINQFNNCLEIKDSLFFEMNFMDNGRQSYYVRLTPMLDDSQVESVLVILEDLTEKKEIENQVLQNYKLTTLGNLAAGIAHELNSPLGVVQLACEMIKSSLEESEPDIKQTLLFVDNVLKSTQRMADVVRQMMRFSKEDLAISKEYFNLNSMIKEVLLMYGKILRTENISVDFELSPELPPLYGNQNQLQTVITDMISQARESFRGKNKMDTNTLTFKTSYSNELDCINLEVINNGREIADNIKDRIFDPLFTTDDIGGGTGFGLSVSYNIIKKHGGMIGIESEVGKGTHFKILFPSIKKEECDEQ